MSIIDIAMTLRPGERIEPPEWIGILRRPTLGDVIDEIYAWWNEVGSFVLGQDQPDAPGDR